MKRIVQALLTSLLLFGSAFAECGYPYGYSDGPVTTLINPCGFYVGLTGICAVPTETGLGMFTDSWIYANPDGSLTALSKPSRNRYKGAGAIKVGYDFAGNGNNIEVEYLHLYNSRHNVNDSTGAVGFGSAFFNLSAQTPPFIVSDSFLRYRLNQVDVTAGHRFITASNCLQLHPFAGVRYTNLRHNLDFLVGHVRTHYWGVGPTIGIDGDYYVCKGFGVFGRFDTSLLFGEVRADSLLTLPPFPNTRFVSPKTNRMVTSLGARLGVTYNYVLCQGSRIRLELGYLANVYIGPLDIIQSIVSLAPASPPRIDTIQTTNFSFSGPYLSLNWHI